MQLPLLPIAMAFGFVAATPFYPPASGGSFYTWAPGGPGDFRGPCPMMNTLANHGFIPHDGRNITREAVISAMGNALNFDSALATIMFDQAIIANPEPNATFFTLDQLNVHNLLEHDASLSRTDAFFGNNHVFNATVFAETKSYWTDPLLSATMLANSKLARQITSRAFNPTYRFTTTTEAFSLGEVAAPIIAFGDLELGTVKRDLVEFLFENEKLPVELGWSRKTELITLEKILRVSNLIRNATSLFTPSTGGNAERRWATRDLHAALRG